MTGTRTIRRGRTGLSVATPTMEVALFRVGEQNAGESFGLLANIKGDRVPTKKDVDVPFP